MRWQRRHVEYKTTIVTILCDERFIPAGERALVESRAELERYIERDPVFLTTHAPHQPLADAPELARRMCEATARVNVGPMAAVAAALAERALWAMKNAGAKEAVVDNGGDIAFCIREPVRVGLFAGESSVRDLAFEVEPREEPFSICTSSGTVGPSFSYGKADAAVIVSSDILLADAAATALGNRIKTESDLETCFNFLDELPEVEGAMAVLRDKISLWGKLPKIVRSTVDWDLITKGEIG